MEGRGLLDCYSFYGCQHTYDVSYVSRDLGTKDSITKLMQHRNSTHFKLKTTRRSEEKKKGGVVLAVRITSPNRNRLVPRASSRDTITYTRTLQGARVTTHAQRTPGSIRPIEPYPRFNSSNRIDMRRMRSTHRSNVHEVPPHPWKGERIGELY